MKLILLDTDLFTCSAATWPCQAKPGPRASMVVKQQASKASPASSKVAKAEEKKIEKKDVPKSGGTVAPTTPPELLEKVKPQTTKSDDVVEVVAADPAKRPKSPNHPPSHDHPPHHHPPSRDPPSGRPTVRPREPLHNVENLVCTWLT